MFRWVRQDRVDRGELEGRPTDETAELRAARRRIVELEGELATVRRTSELFAEGRVDEMQDAELKSLRVDLRDGRSSTDVTDPLVVYKSEPGPERLHIYG